MPKWEYCYVTISGQQAMSVRYGTKTETVSKKESDIAMLHRLGQEGWEAFATLSQPGDTYQILLKRPRKSGK